MIANPLISITIPTYNRAELLDYSLEIHIPLARAHNVQIFISDNASTDATEEIVKKRMKEYSLIQYHRNEKNLGPDKNFELALKYPRTQYVWLLGDSYQLPPEGIDYLLNLISSNKQKYDVIVFNLADQVTDVKAQNFTDSNNLLCSLGALMTCMSCLVYNIDFIMDANFARYRNSYFIQTGIIFESIATHPFCISWVKSVSVRNLDQGSFKKDSWTTTPNVFEIACKKWVSFIFSLPVSYELNNKLKCLTDFTKVSSVFSFRHLLLIRSQDILNYKTYKQYSYLFPLTMKYSKTSVLLITLLPRSILIILKTTIKAIQRYI